MLTPAEERHARMNELEKRLGPMCDIGFLPFFRAYARPFESADEFFARHALLEAMIIAEGNQLQAAKLLGITPREMLYRLSRYGARRGQIDEAVRPRE